MNVLGNRTDNVVYFAIYHWLLPFPGSFRSQLVCTALSPCSVRCAAWPNHRSEYWFPATQKKGGCCLPCSTKVLSGPNQHLLIVLGWLLLSAAQFCIQPAMRIASVGVEIKSRPGTFVPTPLNKIEGKRATVRLHFMEQSTRTPSAVFWAISRHQGLNSHAQLRENTCSFACMRTGARGCCSNWPQQQRGHLPELVANGYRIQGRCS